jgi:hypothetical protein
MKYCKSQEHGTTALIQNLQNDGTTLYAAQNHCAYQKSTLITTVYQF